jgi:hypothetical protein
MKSEKEKLAAKTIDQLKAAAKRLGGKLVTPDGKAKTKVQLINTIVMKNRLAGKSMGANQTGTSNAAKDRMRKAKAPGKRTSAKGKVYTETRKNRTDKPGSLLGQKIQDYRAIENVRIFEAVFLGPTNVSGARVKINDYRFNESKTIPFGYKTNSEGQTAAEYLNTLGIKIVAKGETQKGTVLFTKNFEKSIKDKA